MEKGTTRTTILLLLVALLSAVVSINMIWIIDAGYPESLIEDSLPPFFLVYAPRNVSKEFKEGDIVPATYYPDCKGDTPDILICYYAEGNTPKPRLVQSLGNDKFQATRWEGRTVKIGSEDYIFLEYRDGGSLLSSFTYNLYKIEDGKVAVLYRESFFYQSDFIVNCAYCKDKEIFIYHPQSKGFFKGSGKIRVIDNGILRQPTFQERVYVPFNCDYEVKAIYFASMIFIAIVGVLFLLIFYRGRAVKM